MDSSEKILPLLKDSNLLVALNASWALGNLADTLDKDQLVYSFNLYFLLFSTLMNVFCDIRNSLLEELPRDFLINLIRAAVQAAQGPMKVLVSIICISLPITIQTVLLGSL